jgi:hypothetical protein
LEIHGEQLAGVLGLRIVAKESPEPASTDFIRTVECHRSDLSERFLSDLASEAPKWDPDDEHVAIERPGDSSGAGGGGRATTASSGPATLL